MNLDLIEFACRAIAHYETAGDHQRARALLWWLWTFQRGLS